MLLERQVEGREGRLYEIHRGGLILIVDGPKHASGHGFFNW